MTQEKQNRIRYIRVHFTPLEFDCVNTHWRQSTHRKRSEYLRNLMLGKPVIVRHRNHSLDDLMAALIPLREELNPIGRNYNHEAAWELVSIKITEIKTIISHIDDQWLQS
jgi:hypothetical protein